MKVLVWATTFGADLWSLARRLDARDDVELRIVLDDPDRFRRQAVARLFPLRAPLIRRGRLRTYAGPLAVPGFRPDVVVLDNWVPKVSPARRGFVLWHGFGWKGPNDREEFAPLHRQLARAFGDPLRPNPNFRWHCFGPSDFEHRTQVSGFAPENCRLVGAVSHDDLRTPLDRSLVRDAYPFDVVKRRTVLIAPTWHYGEVFAHWGSDAAIFDRLLERIAHHGANAIVRFHDRHRYDPNYLRTLEDLARRHGNTILKFKDRDPDNFVDLQVADVLVTNFSSIANLYYATLRPTIHVYPVRSADEAFTWRIRRRGGVETRQVASVRYVWKFPPEQNGGLLVHDPDEMIAALDRAFEDPQCCRERARAFLDAHMLGADGHAAERAFAVLRELVCGDPPPRTTLPRPLPCEPSP